MATITEWKPKTQQLAAARYIAIGCTWEHTMAKCDIASRTTLATWLRNPNFAALVQEMRERAFEAIEADIWQNVRLALEVQRQMFSGEISADDKRIAHADKLIGRFLDKLAPAAAEPVGPATAGPATAIQINNYPAGPHALAAGQPIDYTGAIEGERTNGHHPVHDAHDAEL